MYNGEKKIYFQKKHIYIDICNKDDTYQYEYQNICYIKCPNETESSNSDEYLCELKCSENLPYEIISTQECVENCTSEDLFNNKCKLNYQNSNLEDKMINDVQNYIQENNLSPNESKVFESNNNKYQIAPLGNQNDNENNDISTIDIGECEQKIRKYYCIPDNEELLLFKIDVYKEGYNMPVVEYEIYRYKTGEKLELNICNGMTAEISVPTDSIDENKIYLYDPNSDFYNDVCYTYTSEKGTDVCLEDRKNEYIENNRTLCEEDCSFNGYDTKTKKAKCQCKIKINLLMISEITIDKTKLKDSFTNLPTVANFWVMKCYTVLFSKIGILNNIGAYILIPIIILQIIFIIIFYKRDYPLIKKVINYIVYIKKNYKGRILTIKNNKNEHELKLQNNKIIKNKLKIKNENKDNKTEPKKNLKKLEDNKKKDDIKKVDIKFEIKIDDKLINVIKENKEKDEINNSQKENNKEFIEKEKPNINTRIKEPIYIQYQRLKNENIIKDNNPPYKNRAKRLKRKNNTSIHSLRTNDLIFNKNDCNLDLSHNLINNKKKDDIKQLNNKLDKIDIHKIMKKNDYELNILKYEEALLIDKRTYIEYYFSLLKINHLLFFPFRNNDYNSIMIKIYLFFFSFDLYFAINALFFSDSTMHKIYEDGGSFDFIYQIPQILYSIIISSFVNALVKFFSLSEKKIIEIKNEINIQNLDKKSK